MAINIDVTPGTGKTIAADEVAAVLYQRVKLSVGAAGVVGDATPTNPLPVSLAGPAFASSFGVGGAVVSSADATAGVMITDLPTTGQKIVIDDVLFTSTATGTLDVAIRCETSGVEIARFQIVPKTSFQWTPKGKIKLATADNRVQLFALAAGQIYATVTYHSEA